MHWCHGGVNKHQVFKLDCWRMQFKGFHWFSHRVICNIFYKDNLLVASVLSWIRVLTDEISIYASFLKQFNFKVVNCQLFNQWDFIDLLSSQSKSKKNYWQCSHHFEGFGVLTKFSHWYTHNFLTLKVFISLLQEVLLRFKLLLTPQESN